MNCQYLLQWNWNVVKCYIYTTYNSEKCKKYDIHFTSKTPYFEGIFNLCTYEQQELSFLQMFISFANQNLGVLCVKRFFGNFIILRKLYLNLNVYVCLKDCKGCHYSTIKGYFITPERMYFELNEILNFCFICLFFVDFFCQVENISQSSLFFVSFILNYSRLNFDI